MKNVKTFNEFVNEAINEAKFKEGQYVKSKNDSDKFAGDVYDVTNDVDGTSIPKNSSFEIQEIGKDEVILYDVQDDIKYSIEPDDLKHFVKESNATINEGVLAKKGVAKLSDYSLVGAHDPELKEFDDKLAKLLGERDYKNIIQVDTEYEGNDPIQGKIFDYLENNFSGSSVPGMDGDFQEFVYDKKLNVARISDHGIMAYLFTNKSKF